MFAYCNNSPVVYTDFSGTAARPTTVAISDCRAIAPGMAHELQLYWRREANRAAFSDALFELVHLRSTGNPEEALQADYFAMYKGTLVIKTNILEDNTGFSFGVVFIGKNSDDIDTVQHEYGHRKHLSQIGLYKYATYIVLPSIALFHLDGEYSKYYSYPWEYIADMLGGVSRDNGKYNYSDSSTKWASIYYWLTLIA